MEDILIVDGVENSTTVMAEVDDPKMELTVEDQEKVKQYIDAIDIHDTQLVMQYGAGAQKKIADFSDTALATVKTKDFDRFL